MSKGWWLSCLAVGLSACGGGRPALDQVGAVVTMGDSASTSPAYAQSFVSLLYHNDATRFPEYAGADLESRLGVPLLRLEHPGDSYHGLASLPAPDVPTASLVLVQLGFNDMLYMMLKLFMGNLESTLIEEMRVAVRTVLMRLKDSGSLIVVVDAYDPSDGVGDVTDIAGNTFPLIRGALQPEVVRSAELAFRQMLREEADRANAMYVSVHDAFIGHGFHAATPNDRWLRDLFDPSLRGAHEMRRVVWEALADDVRAGVTRVLPEDDALTIPAVPVEGWANAVVISDVTQMIDAGELGGVVPNVATDAKTALGPPDDDSVALGLVGAYIVVDLGANEVARDGAGADLVVLELGGGNAGVPEPYRVSIATSPGGPFVPLGDGRGPRAFFLSGQSARYVRVESGAYLAEVIGGFGSPLYPGPEIVAIGAVHPGN